MPKFEKQPTAQEDDKSTEHFRTEFLGPKTPELSPEIVEQIIAEADPKKIASFFECTEQEIVPAVSAAIEKIFSAAGAADRPQIEGLVRQALRHLEELSQLQADQLIHGTGTDALYRIIRDGKMIPGGAGLGGADTAGGHKTEGSYISVSQNSNMGYALSYVYAKQFESTKTKGDWEINADSINNSNAAVESFDSIPAGERQRIIDIFETRGVKVTREYLEKNTDRPLYFDRHLAEEKILLYQQIVRDIEDNWDKVISQGPNADAITDDEIDTLLLNPKATIDPIRRRLWSNIRRETWENGSSEDKEYLLKTYQGRLANFEKQLSAFESLDPDEQQRQEEQHAVIIIIDKSAMGEKKLESAKEKNGELEPIHPSGKEIRVHGDIELSAVSAIQAPEKELPEIEKWIKERISATADEAERERLSGIKLIPLELYEVERVIRKELNESKSSLSQ